MRMAEIGAEKQVHIIIYLKGNIVRITNERLSFGIMESESQSLCIDPIPYV